MKTLQELLNKLPKELQEHIEEYNVNHRPSMKKVLQELIHTDNTCNFCREEITNEDEKYYGLYIYTWNSYKYIYCGPECGEVGDRGILKARRNWLKRLNSL
jgi:hydrogenase maturation factor HypF (carbamoyltransferase family)